MSTTKQGTEYELFVKDIYERLHAYEGVENIELQHNVVLQGKSGAMHQIDIYWQFKMAGVTYQVAIECKDYDRPVTKEKIAAFQAILQDLGSVRGIFASKNGFQKGAKQLAERYGIQLMEIRKPNDKDWEGRIRNMHFTITARMLENVRVEIKADFEWCKKNFPADVVEIPMSGMDNELFIDDKVAGTRVSLYDIKNSLSTDQVGKDFVESICYEDAYLSDNENTVKILEIIYTYDIVEASETLDILGDTIVKALVKDVSDGTAKTVDFSGEVRERRELS